MELQKIVIEGAAAGPHLLITGGVHGDEYEPMPAIRRLAAELGADQVSGRLTLVPVVNEAAYALKQRCAADDLDLARTCPGKVDGSITERTAHSLSELIETADYYIDLHTGGQICQVLPFSGYALHADAKILEVQRQMARAFSLPFIWGTAAGLKGRSLSVAHDAGIPAIYAEYLGNGVCSEAGVRAYTEGCLNVMSMLGIIDRLHLDPYIEYVVEDERPNAGHMQLHNPAPIAGFFEPAVTLGQLLREGAELGTVSDVTGSDVRQVTSPDNGIVLTLRTRPRVEEGDSLAVIVDVERPLNG
ncbi:MAG: succinylglutamate desuccinylase/aspartoacylase family protein [Lentisphaeria bacterium]|nr:succinylglutamate desuccinylase/aspartoacylase family protein [Lentisphaeria bacterium]MDP7743132.1 succinylglutamate desuccinylase/aspartoacylase family protein [Lentisphaeria bacterium]